jgi:hypothetical protein
MRALQHKLRSNGPVGLRTPRDLVATAGRVALWLVVAMLLVRGAGAMLDHSSDARAPHAAPGVKALEWPDDAAGALAVEFATTYLSHAPGDAPEAVAQRLNTLASAELSGELVPRFDRDAPAQTVRSATVARTVRVDESHALVTVAATLSTGDQLGSRRLTVPIARGTAGGLVVDDLPSFTAAPSRASIAAPEEEPLLGADRGPIEDVVTRFLRAYLAGDSGGLSYLVVPGTRIAATSGRLELLSLATVLSAGGDGRRRRVVLATVHARDLGSRALYMLRYRVALVRRDRWYVAELNEEGAGR